MPGRSDALGAEELPVTNAKLKRYRVRRAAASHHVTLNSQPGLKVDVPMHAWGTGSGFMRGSVYVVLLIEFLGFYCCSCGV